METKTISGEFMIDQTNVAEVAQLTFARGKVGERYKLTSVAEKDAFAQALASHTAPLTKENTADCGDERRTLHLADGTTDPGLLQTRIAPQLFGGEGLATTKALVAADAAVIKDAKSMWDAYLIVSRMLTQMGEEDGGHLSCGASASVESSVANIITLNDIEPAINLMTPAEVHKQKLLNKNQTSKQARLSAGFYSGWTAGNHEDYLSTKFPQNFSYLAEDPNDHETHGHNGSGIYVVTGTGLGFEKNKFITDTGGNEAFAVTVPKMQELAQKFGGSQEEQQRILYAFIDDTLHVGAGIVIKDMPVFAQSV